MSVSISWLSDEAFTFNGEEIQRSSFQRNFIGGMLADAQRILQEKLLFGTSLPEVPLVQIVDEMRNTTPGYSFLTEPRNAALFSEGFSTLKSRCLEAKDLHGYIIHVNHFLELILMLCLTTGDQPPHSYDLACLLLVNTQDYARSLFLMSEECGPGHHGNMLIITTSLDRKFIHRPLPSDVSALLVLYLVDILPFLRRHQLTGVPGHGDLICCNHLFPEGWTHWSEAKYQSILKRESKQRLGVELDLAGYKACYLAISERFSPGRFDEEGNCVT